MNALALEAIRQDDDRQRQDEQDSDLQYRRDMARNQDEFHNPNLTPERIDYADGPANGAFGARPEFYIPRTMDPIANRERTRQAGDMTARQDEGLQQELQPLEDLRNAATLRMKGRAAQDTADYGAGLEAKRYWDPMTHSMIEESDQRKIRLATEPARIAANSREQVADITGDSRVDAARARVPDQLTQALGLVPKVAAAGGFGVDREGNRLAPPENIQRSTTDALSRMMSGAQGGVQAPRYSPDIEAEIQRGLSLGVAGPSGAPATREEIAAHLRQLGRIK
jgi:hypothetical protein